MEIVFLCLIRHNYDRTLPLRHASSSSGLGISKEAAWSASEMNVPLETTRSASGMNVPLEITRSASGMSNSVEATLSAFGVGWTGEVTPSAYSVSCTREATFSLREPSLELVYDNFDLVALPLGLLDPLEMVLVLEP